ncbi:2-oxo acid dehydrogenase subunit E2 [Anaerolineales bacterium HSG25]|nr:2-oxo acid dehydrogenase subunit E2 [Anaerolineales bacterium HSG25]
MAEFKLPELGENITGGDVVGVLVAVGDIINADQDILELETDKATVTVPVNSGGTITAIHIQEGDRVEVGQLVLTMDGGASNGSAAPTSESATPSPSAPVSPTTPAPQATVPATFNLPELGENITGGDVVGVLVSVGDTVTVDQDVIELETDKATVTVPSSVAGTITAINIQEGDRVEIGQLILTVAGTTVSISAPAPMLTPAVLPVAVTPTTTQPATPLSHSTTTIATDPIRSAVPAAPNVRRLARELGLDITQVPVGPSGRINIYDLKAYSRQLNSGAIKLAPISTPVPSTSSTPPPPSPQATRPAAVSKSLPDFSKWGEIEVEKMSGIRRATSNQMAYSWSAPRVTQFDKADIGELEALRQKFGKRLEKSGAKLTITAILLKIAAAALKEFPKFNASIDVANDSVIMKKYYHIGVAVDTERGLIVPVIRDVDRKNIFELAIELAELAKKARDRKLGLEDMQGGTFTISNLGGIGGTNFTPIVNAPEVAILGVARGSKEPVYNGETFEPHLMMPLALSYDHRLIDGAEGAHFLRWISKALENPLMMSLQSW